ncbi:B12-binding domain-containing radical SAM protein [Nisaea nitritireducens]|uniref:B12-binding domain-containing radical SAM protein n=1 Tax=Nisaea nitritireducens TaxID=568392 RepID=UPI001867EA3B|nr:radical SAM protein [Nisaea nitritireducens]
MSRTKTVPNVNWLPGLRPRKILLAVMPYEGEVRDKVTDKFYKNSAVKYMPLGVLSIAACIPDCYEVKVLDAASRGLTLEETINEIEAFAPDVLGLSVVTYRAWSMVQILKRCSAPVKVVGGPHATKSSAYIIEQGADAVFIDDAEVTFPKWLANGCPKGVFDGGQADLNALPLPARHLLDKKDYYIEHNDDLLFDVGRLRLPVFTSKGCPFSCIYCDVQQKTFNFKSPERVAEEFADLVEYGATSIHILDDAFNIRKNRVVGISQVLAERGIDIDWSARGTVEVREEVIAELAAAGCKRLHVGIESLDDKVLQNLKKAQRYKHIETFANHCAKHGIDILGYFIMGSPGETEAYRQKLPEMIADLGIRIPYFNILSPLAETPYYSQLLKEGRFERDHWDDFSREPVKDFIMPDVRPQEERAMLESTIVDYVSYFKRRDMHVFAA